MACGHAANATSNNKPVCCICECSEIVEEKELVNRKARCFYCNCTVDSSYTLPFFKYEKDKLSDSYYCGCRGWD